MDYYLYMIRLKPVGEYFFGGEVTFGEGSEQNYYVHSNRLPQVSTLLGVVRYEILRQRNLLSYDVKNKDVLDKVGKLIGHQGFTMIQGVDGYGIIHQLSPLFVERRETGRFYTPMPLDYKQDVKFDDGTPCAFSSSCVQKKAVRIAGYDAKNKNNYRYWVSGDGEELAEEKIFYEREQIGITKNGRNPNEKDAFFKMVAEGLRDGFNFAFTLETAEPIEEVCRLVVVGGNRSMFTMSISRMEPQKEDYFQAYFKVLRRDGRLLLLGDAFLTDEERDRLPFFWAVSQCNRYIVTPHAKGHGWDKPRKTKLYRLLARGGVIYASKAPSPTYLNCVGLNIFI